MTAREDSAAGRWQRLAFTGAFPRAAREAFNALLPDDRACGRLVLEGDTIEFLNYGDDAGNRLLVAKTDQRPYFQETLDILLAGATRVLFADHEPYPEYLAEVTRRASSVLQVTRWTWTGTPEHCSARYEPFVRAVRAAMDSLPAAGRWTLLLKTPPDCPLFPPKFPSVYKRGISGHGPDGAQLRRDIACW